MKNEYTGVVSFADFAKFNLKNRGGDKGYGDASNRISYGLSRPENKKARVIIIIGEFYMKEANMIIGDYVDILYYPEDNLGIIKRVSKEESPIKLTKIKGAKHRGRIDITFNEGMPNYKKRVNLSRIDIQKNEIRFDFPKQN